MDTPKARVEISFTRYAKEICDFINGRFDGAAREAAYETVRWIGKNYRIDDKLGIVTEIVGG